MTARPLAAALFLLLAPRLLAAQVVNPADKQKPPEEQAAQDQRLRSYELPAMQVEGERESSLREEDRIGSYGQPRWTATRRFPTTRIYVLPEGKFGFEYWLRARGFDDMPTQIQNQYEFEFGLPYRFQLDLYAVYNQDGSTGSGEVNEIKTEVRWALADWGEIPANPTLYLEWEQTGNEPDVLEGKLLLGDEFAEGWHWGSNLVVESQTGGDKANAYELTLGVSRTIVDTEFSVGAEGRYELEDNKLDRGNYEHKGLIGPSVQWHPLPQATLDIAPLIGVTSDAPDIELFVVFGWEF